MFPVRVMARLGVKTLVGGSLTLIVIKPGDLDIFDYSDKRRWIAQPQHIGGHKYVTSPVPSAQPNVPRQVVVLHDHLGIPCLSGFNPLLGPQHDTNIPRFLPTSNAYSSSLRRLFFHAVHELGLNVDDFAEGTYAWVSGPTFESPAEGRFLRAAGADVVGMSTVPEILAAREEGLEVIALSLVTNSVVIPDTYRSIKDEVKAEVTAYSLLLRKVCLPLSVPNLARREDRRGPPSSGCLSPRSPRNRPEKSRSHAHTR